MYIPSFVLLNLFNPLRGMINNKTMHNALSMYLGDIINMYVHKYLVLNKTRKK